MKQRITKQSEGTNQTTNNKKRQITQHSMANKEHEIHNKTNNHKTRTQGNNTANTRKKKTNG